MQGNRVEKAKTGWLAGAFGWRRTQPKEKTEPQPKLGHLEVRLTESLPPNLSANVPANLPADAPSAPPLESLPNYLAENVPPPVPLAQMQVAPVVEPLNNLDTDEGIEIKDEAALEPLPEPLKEPSAPPLPEPLPQALVPVSQELSAAPSRGALPAALPKSLESIPQLTSNQVRYEEERSRIVVNHFQPDLEQGLKFYQQLEKKLPLVHTQWIAVVKSAAALQIAQNAKLGDKTIANKQAVVLDDVNELIKLIGQMNYIVHHQKITLAMFATDKISGKHLCAQIDDELDMMRSNLTKNLWGEVEVRLHENLQANLLSAIRLLKDSCFYAMASKLIPPVEVPPLDYAFNR